MAVAAWDGEKLDFISCAFRWCVFAVLFNGLNENTLFSPICDDMLSMVVRSDLSFGGDGFGTTDGDNLGAGP